MLVQYGRCIGWASGCLPWWATGGGWCDWLAVWLAVWLGWWVVRRGGGGKYGRVKNNIYPLENYMYLT